MKCSPNSLIFHLTLLTLLSYPLLFQGLGARDLWSSHEARAAQNAYSILESGQWTRPQLFDGRRDLQKPPIYYALVAGIAKLHGEPVDAWAVRLPSALAATGGVLGIYLLCRLRGRPQAGLLAALMLATMVHYTWLARVGRIDMSLALATTIAVAAFYLGFSSLKEGRPQIARLGFATSYVALAAAVLLKGPVGLVLPALVIGAFLFVEGEITRVWKARRPWRLVHDLGLWWGLPLVAALTMPFFLWLNQQTEGEFFREFFLKHNLKRGLGGDETLDDAGHSWWLYGPRLLADLFPWSLLLPLALWALMRRGWWREDREARFGALWLGGMLLFLSCMRFKRADYLVPAYPGAALLLGAVTERWLGQLRPRVAQWTKLGLAGIVGVCTLAWVVFVNVILPTEDASREHRTFAHELRRRAPAPAPIVFFRTESHPLTFHVGRPVVRIWEWSNLDIWACRPERIYLVMPPEWFEQCPQYLEAGRLYPVLSNSELAGLSHHEPLVLLANQSLN